MRPVPRRPTLDCRKLEGRGDGHAAARDIDANLGVRLAAIAVAVVAAAWDGLPDLRPIADPSFLLHQDRKDPFNIADQRECTTAFPYVPLWFGDPPVLPGRGEFFGFSTGS